MSKTSSSRCNFMLPNGCSIFLFSSIVKMHLLIIVIRTCTKFVWEKHVLKHLLIEYLFRCKGRRRHIRNTPGRVRCYYSNLHIKTISIVVRKSTCTHMQNSVWFVLRDQRATIILSNAERRTRNEHFVLYPLPAGVFVLWFDLICVTTILKWFNEIREWHT